jgi:hypothetical protein
VSTDGEARARFYITTLQTINRQNKKQQVNLPLIYFYNSHIVYTNYPGFFIGKGLYNGGLAFARET